MLEISTLVAQNVPNCELKAIEEAKDQHSVDMERRAKIVFNAPLTGLMSEIVYKIFKIRWRFCPHPIFVGRESKRRK